MPPPLFHRRPWRDGLRGPLRSAPSPEAPAHDHGYNHEDGDPDSNTDTDAKLPHVICLAVGNLLLRLQIAGRYIVQDGELIRVVEAVFLSLCGVLFRLADLERIGKVRCEALHFGDGKVGVGRIANLGGKVLERERKALGPLGDICPDGMSAHAQCRRRN